MDMAVELSGSCDARLHLVMVVHEVSTLPGERAASAVLMPSAASALLDMDCEDAELYLVELMGKLLDQHINVTGQVERGEPARQILQAAADIKADLIVLGTHGKTAMEAFWSGSLTPKITTQTNIPLLLFLHKE
jgi:nucleotide-binding universal stress UspA family protein